MGDWPDEYGCYPPGHYHSPVPSLDEVRRDRDRLFGGSAAHLPGIDLNEDGQLELLAKIAGFYRELPFKDQAEPGLRYYFDNAVYSYSDAIFLYGMLRAFEPARIIEIGSGFSSAVMLDTIDLFLDHKVECTFIEPSPDRLHDLMRQEDYDRTTIHEKRLQEVDPEVFAGLDAGDILFVDSSHVSKIGSDVNQIIFEILPTLAPGVLVHVHDIFFPFEYPEKWLLEIGMYWNEAYVLRAFLEHNPAFQIRVWNHYLAVAHNEHLASAMPLCMENTGGSIWLQRL